uniref:Uncharacterized protein n=1 Tax=viral metagenome TaxID=1070528 RepID=A0A6C0C248_9ZZZZ
MTSYGNECIASRVCERKFQRTVNNLTELMIKYEHQHQPGVDSGAAFVAGIVFAVASVSTLTTVSTMRNLKRTDRFFYFTEALNWISLMFAAVLISYAALDLPKVLHAWRVSRCQ